MESSLSTGLLFFFFADEESVVHLVEVHEGACGEATACAEDVLQALALLEERVDNRDALGEVGSLEEEAEEGTEEWVEVVQSHTFEEVSGGGGARSLLSNADSGEELCQDHEIEHNRDCQQRVLARVVENTCVVSAHADFRRVLVHGTLAVLHERDVLDVNAVVRSINLNLAFFVDPLREQLRVAEEDIVHNVLLRCLL